MIKPNQFIKLNLKSCNSQYKEYYKSLGYEITDSTLVRAEDLCSNSHKKIIVICDYCGKEFEIQKK